MISHEKIKPDVDDNQKISLKDYRALLYEQIKERDRVETGTHTPITGILGKTETESSEVAKY